MSRSTMHNDAAHATVATSGAILIYGYTLADIVAALWVIYVAILILTKLPALMEAVLRIRRCVVTHWARWTGGRHGRS